MNNEERRAAVRDRVVAIIMHPGFPMSAVEHLESLIVSLQKPSLHGNARLTDEDVKTIKTMIWDGYRYYQIADVFHISIGHVSNIAQGLTREYIPWPDGTSGRLPRSHRRQLNEEKARRAALNKQALAPVDPMILKPYHEPDVDFMKRFDAAYEEIQADSRQRMEDEAQQAAADRKAQYDLDVAQRPITPEQVEETRKARHRMLHPSKMETECLPWELIQKFGSDIPLVRDPRASSPDPNIRDNWQLAVGMVLARFSPESWATQPLKPVERIFVDATAGNTTLIPVWIDEETWDPERLA